jgi:hypothetical protein
MGCPVCNGTTLSNKPCRLRSCKFAPQCYHHTSVEVKRSGIPNAGMGLFARAPVKKGAVLVNYTHNTVRMTETQFKKKYPTGRATHVAYVNGAYYDAKDISKNVAGAANNAGPRKSGRVNNAYIAKSGNMKATKNIPKGREVLTAYGAGFRL